MVINHSSSLHKHDTQEENGIYLQRILHKVYKYVMLDQHLDTGPSRFLSHDYAPKTRKVVPELSNLKTSRTKTLIS